MQTDQNESFHNFNKTKDISQGNLPFMPFCHHPLWKGAIMVLRLTKVSQKKEKERSKKKGKREKERGKGKKRKKEKEKEKRKEKKEKGDKKEGRYKET